MKAEKPARTKTKTSAFGSVGRSSHDSSAFYRGRLYEDQPRAMGTQTAENALPEANLNRIFTASSEDMSQLPDCSIHLMVTSPPYNVGKEYDKDLTLAEHLAFLRRVWGETYRVLVPGGRACINIANLGRKPYIPLHAHIIADMIGLGFLMRGEIIWDKGNSASRSTAWGSWQSASNPVLRDVHEYILVFSKGDFRRQPTTNHHSTISRRDFLRSTRSLWSIAAESATRVGHPAPFPIELPRRLIQLYTFAGDVVLDPFMGSGQTAIAALKSRRSFVGYEKSPRYSALARKRIRVADR